MSIALQVQKPIEGHDSGDSTPYLRVEYEEIKREERGRKYSVVTREYMAEGHDGFECLKGQKYLIDDEQGQLMSTLVRRYLLGQSHIGFIAFHILKTPQVLTTLKKCASLQMRSSSTCMPIQML